MAARLKRKTGKKTPKQVKPPTFAQKKKFTKALNQLSVSLKRMDLQLASIYEAADDSSFWIIG